MPPALKSDKFCSGLCAFFLLLGVFSRLFIYAKGQDLWLDEALLLESFKFLTAGFEYSEFILRLCPLLAGIATLFLAYIFARHEFGTRFACVFLFLLVSSDSLLFYSVNFSFYGIEALLIVICLCVWSFGKKKSAVLICLMLTVIFCIVCNSGQNESEHSFNNFYIQMLGRHFINFHYFVFGKFVWLNALIFAASFCIGSFLLYKEKRALQITIFIAICILFLFSILKITPLGIPYNNFMRLMQNWSQMQVVGSKYIVFLLPLVFIPVAFFIHKVFLKIGSGTLIGVLMVFAFIALSSNFIRIHKGIGSPESTVVLKQLNENIYAKSLIFADSVSRPIFEYYIRQSPFKDNPNLNYFYIKNDGYMYLNDSIFIGKYNGRIEELFNVMKNFKAQSGFFFFTYSNYHPVRQSNELIAYINRNHMGKSKGFQAKQAGAAWVKLVVP